MIEKAIEKHLRLARKEIGEIRPWWSEEDGLYLFEHPAYPRVVHGDSNPAKTEAGYLRALRRFIEYRLKGQLSEAVERETTGHGGRRSGAGRPRKGTVPRIRKWLPADMAAWLDEEKNLEKVRKLMGR